MFNISFLIIVCVLNPIISNDNKNAKENPPPNSCEEKYNKEYCKNQSCQKNFNNNRNNIDLPFYFINNMYDIKKKFFRKK